VLLLYRIAHALPLGPKDRKPIFALIAAGLYIVSPAGIFLVAPFTEAPFALLNIAGHLLYILSWGDDEGSQAHGILQDLYLLAAGACFGLSATVRGNGVLSGLLFFHDAVLWFGLHVENWLGIRVLTIRNLPQDLQGEVRSFKFRRIPATIVAGILTGIGVATPQIIAYLEYCGANERPWCRKFPPSIFTFVQNHYWYVSGCAGTPSVYFC
jgi:phosphatidylinositol glycan class V